MAGKSKKKPARKKPAARRRPPKRPSLGNQLLRVGIGFLLLIALVVAAGYLLYLFFGRPASPPAPPAAPQQTGKAAAPELPPFEVYPDRDRPVRPPLPEEKIPPAAGLPKVALIVDDLGYDRRMAQRFIRLGVPMTFSILPNGPFSKKIADMAAQQGMEIMVHLPMEPNEFPDIDPGPGALLTTMDANELIRQLNEHLDALPTARGVNNHMGSKMTTRAEQLYQIFSVLKKRELYFIDSRTTAETICQPSAKLFQLRFGQRDVFVDHVEEPEFIRKQLRLLIKTAESHGEAIGILHPHSITAQILEERLAAFKDRVRWVPASEVVHPAG